MMDVLEDDRALVPPTNTLPAAATSPGRPLDGHYYRNELRSTCARFEAWCREFEVEALIQEFGVAAINDEVEGRARAATGQAKLLLNKRLPQFDGLCEANITQTVNAESGKLVTDTDLAGFWDLISLAIEDVDRLFARLTAMRASDWAVSARTTPVPAEKKPVAARKKAAALTPAAAASSSEAQLARRRELQARRAALKAGGAPAATDDIVIFTPKRPTTAAAAAADEDAPPQQ